MLAREALGIIGFIALFSNDMTVGTTVAISSIQTNIPTILFFIFPSFSPDKIGYELISPCFI
jgi:hypothetical protein